MRAVGDKTTFLRYLGLGISRSTLISKLLMLKTLDRFGLVQREEEGLFVPPLERAIAQLHQVWNNFLQRD